MGTRLIRRLTCDKCQTEVDREADEPWAYPQGWENLTMNAEDNDEPVRLDYCERCMRKFRIFMGWITPDDSDKEGING